MKAARRNSRTGRIFIPVWIISPLMRSAKRALKEAGFYGITFDPEVFEENTGYYHVPVEFKYMEV